MKNIRIKPRPAFVLRPIPSQGWSRPRVLALVVACFLLGGAAVEIRATDLFQKSLRENPDLSSRYYIEWLRSQLQAGRVKAASWMCYGMKYAASGLCENELKGKLNSLLKESDRQLSDLFLLLKQNQLVREKVLKHADLAEDISMVDPVRSRVEMALARIELERLAKLNDQAIQQFNLVGKSLIQSEVLYQRVLADCLLDNFKSIFGGGDLPMPVPADKNFPDESDEEEPSLSRQLFLELFIGYGLLG